MSIFFPCLKISSLPFSRECPHWLLSSLLELFFRYAFFVCVFLAVFPFCWDADGGGEREIGERGESMFQRMPGWLQLLDDCYLMDGKKEEQTFQSALSWNTENQFTGKGEKILYWAAVLDPCHDISWLTNMHVQEPYCLFLVSELETASLITPAF